MKVGHHPLHFDLLAAMTLDRTHALLRALADGVTIEGLSVKGKIRVEVVIFSGKGQPALDFGRVLQ